MSLLDIFNNYHSFIFESTPSQISKTSLQDINDKSLDILDWETKENMITQYILDHSTYSQDEYYYYSFYDDDDIMWSGFNNEIVDEIFVDTDWGDEAKNHLRVRFMIPDEDDYLGPVDFMDCDENLKEELWNYFQKKISLDEGFLFESPHSQLGQTTVQDIEKQSIKTIVKFQDKEIEKIFQENILDDIEYYTDNDDIIEKYKKYGILTKEFFQECSTHNYNAPFEDVDFSNNHNIKTFNELKYFESLQKIPEWAFTDCQRLKEITIPISENFSCIEENAFRYCISLEKVNFEVKNSQPNIRFYIYNNAFAQCKSLKEIHLPEGLVSIGRAAFADCYNLETVYLPSTLTDIEYGAFSNCPNLKNVIGLKIDSNKIKDNFVFYNCPNIPKAYKEQLKTITFFDGSSYDFETWQQDFLQETRVDILLNMFTNYDVEDDIKTYRLKHDLYGTDLFGENYDDWRPSQALITNFQKTYWKQWLEDNKESQYFENQLKTLFNEEMWNDYGYAIKEITESAPNSWVSSYFVDGEYAESIEEAIDWCCSDFPLEDRTLILNKGYFEFCETQVVLHDSQMYDDEKDYLPDTAYDPESLIYTKLIE